MNGPISRIFFMDAVIFYSSLICLFCITLVVLYNLFSDPVLKKSSRILTETPRVAILIPARNEASVIGKSIKAAVGQIYGNYEIIVLDDQSTDHTADIVRSIQSETVPITVLQGENVPSGWVGKNWACHQLSQKAQGKILIFIDADCFLAPWAVASIVSMMKEKNLSLLSCFPAQKTKSPGEKFVVPVMNWLLLSFLPLNLIYYTSHKAVAAANGQLMAFDAKAYKEAGGHERVKGEVVEDMELARLFKSMGRKIMTLLGGKAVSCRMYGSFAESFHGFSKNFFPGFKMSPFLFSPILLLFLYLFVFPYIFIVVNPAYVVHIGLIAIQRIGISRLAKESILMNVLLHPLQMIIMTGIGINSMRVSIGGKIQWKGRRV